MIRTQVMKHLPRARESERGGIKGDVKREASVRGAMEKNKYVGVIEEVRGDDPIEYFLPTRARSNFRVQEGMMVVTIPPE